MHWLSYIGSTRILGIGTANTHGLPPQQAAEASAAYVRPTHWATVRALIDATPQTYDVVRSVGTLGDRPLMVVSASRAWLNRDGATDDARREMNTLHQELTTLSATCEHRVVDGATHGSLVHNQEHAQATSLAIQHVIDVVQQQ
jgi:hypothetical protein